MAKTDQLIAWATKQIEKSRPFNAEFVIHGAKAGVQLSKALKDARRLQEWARGVEARVRAIKPPPKIGVTLKFESEKTPERYFWSQEWFDQARDLYDRARAVTTTADNLDAGLDAHRKEFHILEMPWIAMAASANLTFFMKTTFEGARTEPLERQEIANLEIICGLQTEKPTIHRLNYISARLRKVEEATALLRQFAVGATPFVDLRANKTSADET